MTDLLPGQRFVSTTEPELGLGTVLRLEGRILQVLFGGAGVVRNYAAASAPLLRAVFKVGDRVRGRESELLITRVESRDGLLVYHGEGGSLVESELDDQQVAGTPKDRLVAGVHGPNRLFELRFEALERRAAARRSPAHGLFSARIELLEHQLTVVEAALRQPAPRVLLADEVGLGKTIEAASIVARLLASGRASRVLLLVPEPLVAQWFVELMRRFNLKPAIFDAERVDAIEAAGDGRNPFQDEQLVLTDLPFLLATPAASGHLLRAGWDVLVVDEAHHLEWREEGPSAAYQLVEALALATPSVLLLTATPEQLGLRGHFARLRLLDPARYSDLAHFEREAAHWQQLSKLIGPLLDGLPLPAANVRTLKKILGDEAHLLAADLADERHRQALLDALIDRHGTGRVMFRNRRVSVGGFPKRIRRLTRLPAPSDAALRQALLAEFRRDVGLEPPLPIHTGVDSVADAEHPEVRALLADPRFSWLLHTLEALAPAKLVLICRYASKVALLEAALRLRSGVKVARFHEHLSLMQRDRNAAYFADPEGARLLLCSEIGSEGRNFQFAHHLLLWDLPLDPDLLEQRIGRLDRIGQRHDIEIHHPVVPDSAQEVLARWLDEGIDAFRSSPADGRALLTSFGDEVVHAALACAEAAPGAAARVEALLEATAATHRQQAERLAEGRDRLLELASRRGDGGGRLRAALAEADEDLDLDDFVVRLFEHHGLDADDVGPRSYRFDAEYAASGELAIKEGGETMTFDRALALAREDWPLLRADHPLVQQAIDQLLASPEGASAVLIDPQLPGGTVLLQAIYVVECVADRRLDVERHLPAQPFSVTVDTRLGRRSYRPLPGLVARADENPANVAGQRRVLEAIVPPMLEAAHDALREGEARALITAASAEMEAETESELVRLRALKRAGGAVRESEITALEQRRQALREAIAQARLRLDAVRLVASPAFLRMG